MLEVVMGQATIRVFADGRFLKEIERPVRHVGGHPADAVVGRVAAHQHRGYMVWIAVLAITLLRSRAPAGPTDGRGAAPATAMAA